MGVETFRPSSVMPYHDVELPSELDSVPGLRGVRACSRLDIFVSSGMW